MHYVPTGSANMLTGVRLEFSYCAMTAYMESGCFISSVVTWSQEHRCMCRRKLSYIYNPQSVSILLVRVFSCCHSCSLFCLLILL